MKRDLAIDIGMGLALFGGSVLYLSALPHNLGFADESYFLYEAKRIRDGEVMYRDVFQYVTPIAPHVMAALYWLFGTTMTTARVSTAVVHGLTVILTYASARTLGVMAPLAAVAAFAHVVIAQPSWPFASWHWFSTCVTAVLLLALLRGRWQASARATLVLGAWSGVLIGMQQQRGVIPATAVGLIVVLIGLWSPLPGRTRRASATAHAIAFTAGIVLTVLPWLLAFAVAAGVEPVYHALVRFPMENYRDSFRTTWGSISAFTRVHALDTFPRVLKLSPVALGALLVRIVLDTHRGRAPAAVRPCLVLFLFAAACCASIWYYPDFIHIAFIAAPLFVSAAVSVQALFDAVRPAGVVRAGAWLMGLLALAFSSQHLASYASRTWQRYPHASQTAFGRVDFAHQWEPLLVDAVRARLARSASHELFCYPALVSPYLTTGGRNPTPFQHFHAPVFPPGDVARVIDTIQQRQVPYVLISPMAIRKNDPVAQAIMRDYTVAGIPELTGVEPSPQIWLFERKPNNG